MAELRMSKRASRLPAALSPAAARMKKSRAWRGGRSRRMACPRRRVCAEEEKPSSLVQPEAICVDDIIPRVEFSLPDSHFEMYFDQNERFLRQVTKYWKANPTKRINGPYYLRNVEILAAATSAYAAIQAADVYTWVVHTYCEKRLLGNSPKYIPDALQAIGGDPPISTLWDYQRLKLSPHAKNRVLASITKVPEWVLPPTKVRSL